MRRRISINYPPAGYRLVYIDEIINNVEFEAEVYKFFEKYSVQENTALVNGYITSSYDSIEKKYAFSAY